MGVLLTTLLAAETAHAMPGRNTDHSTHVSSTTTHVSSTKIPRRQFPNFREGMKNEISRYFWPQEGKSRVDIFRETGIRFKNFVAASATRWTFSAPLRAWLKELGYTSMSTKAMSSKSGKAYILVDGKYEVYRISVVGGQGTYALEKKQLVDKGRPLWEQQVDVNGSPGEQSEPVPDFKRPAFDPVPAQNSGEGNVWPPPGAARYGMFQPDPVSQPQHQQQSQSGNVSQPQKSVVKLKENVRKLTPFDKGKKLSGQTWGNVSDLALRLGPGESMTVGIGNLKSDSYTIKPMLLARGTDPSQRTGFFQIQTLNGRLIGAPSRPKEAIAILKGRTKTASVVTVQKVASVTGR